jgi:hypothetical protein
MPLPIQKNPVEPNALYAPQIVLQTAIVNGRLVTSVQMVLASAKVENAGTDSESWTATGQTATEYLPDLANLPADLASLDAQIATLYAEIVTLIGSINGIRKVL